jgi:hypothetical protein
MINIAKQKLGNSKGTKGSEFMEGNIYMQEKELELRQRTRSREIEQGHLIAQATGDSAGIRHMIGQLGTLLVTLGKSLERVERQHVSLTTPSTRASLSGHLR